MDGLEKTLIHGTLLTTTLWVGVGPILEEERIIASSAALTPGCSSGRLVTYLQIRTAKSVPATPRSKKHARQPHCLIIQLTRTGAATPPAPTPARKMLVP